MLSWDGEWLWLSQHSVGLIHRLDPATHQSVQTIEIGAKIYGHTWVGTTLFVSAWLGQEHGGAVLARVERSDPGTVRHVASCDFKMIALAYDGDTLWTNDRKDSRVVALRLPLGTL